MAMGTGTSETELAAAPPGEPTTLRRIGTWLLAGSLLWWAAVIFLLPRGEEDFFVGGESARDQALNIVAHQGLFRGFHVLAALGTAAASVGVVLLGRWLAARRPSRLAKVAVAMAAVGTLAWVAEVVLRLTVTVSRAEEVANGLRAPGEQHEAAIASWPLFVVSLAAIVAPMLCSWVLAGRRVPGRKSSLAVAGLATVATAAGLAILAPLMVYQFATLVMAVALLLARPQASGRNEAHRPPH